MADADHQGELESYIASCEEWLWHPVRGTVYRRYLNETRGLGDRILRANRVGADPGPSRMARADGLPHGGIGVTFPLLDPEGRTAYVQTRQLNLARVDKYLNPDSRWPNPKMGVVPFIPNPHTSLLIDGVVERTGRPPIILCEGMPDALTAAQAGFPAAAVLGTGVPQDEVARWLYDHHSGWVVVAYDQDQAGRRAVAQLGRALGDLNYDTAANLPLPGGVEDLNAWAQRDGPEIGRAMADQLAWMAPAPQLTPDRPALGLYRGR